MICYELPDLPQRLQCSQADKQECLHTVQKLAELVAVSRRDGFLALQDENYTEEDPFFSAAIHALLEFSDPAMLKEVLFSYLAAGNAWGKDFLNQLLIAQGMLLLNQQVLPEELCRRLQGWFGADFAEIYQRTFFKCPSQQIALCESLIPQFDGLTAIPTSRLLPCLPQLPTITLALALRGAGRPVQSYLLGLLPVARSKEVADRMASLTSIRRTDAETAQREILQALKIRRE